MATHKDPEGSVRQQIVIDKEFRKRIKLAAVKADLTIKAFIMKAINQAIKNGLK